MLVALLLVFSTLSDAQCLATLCTQNHLLVDPATLTEYGTPRCIAANAKFCRRPLDGPCANTRIVDAGLNGTADVGVCPPFSATIASDPCSTVRCGAGSRCVAIGTRAVCSDLCTTKCGVDAQCQLSVNPTSQEISATCGSPVQCLVPCAAAPSGCQNVPDPLIPCSCRVVCACLNRCGPREYCNNLPPTAACACVPGDRRPLCPSLPLSDANAQTCNADGLSWSPARPSTCPCPEAPCVAPAGCTYVPNLDVPADSDGCRRTCNQYRVVCRQDNCFNCSNSAAFCAAPAQFNASGSPTLTALRPTCFCRPGNSFVRGCVNFTCNAEGTAFTETRTGSCCTPGTTRAAPCNNTCICSSSGVFECTRNPCPCPEGTSIYRDCQKCTCTAGVWGCESKPCRVDQCVDSSSGTVITADSPTSDLCLVKRCVVTNGAATLLALPSASTCRRDLQNGVTCYRVVFEDFRTVDVAAFRARIGANLIQSFEIVVSNDRLVAYVCLRTARARAASDVCDSAASDCQTILNLGSIASIAQVSIVLLLALLFFAL